MANLCKKTIQPVIDYVGGVVDLSNVDDVLLMGSIPSISMGLKRAYSTVSMDKFLKFYNDPVNEKFIRLVGTTALGNQLLKSYKEGKLELEDHYKEYEGQATEFIELLTNSLNDFKAVLASSDMGDNPMKGKLISSINNYILNEHHNKEKEGWGTITNFVALNKGEGTSLFEYITRFAPDVRKEILDDSDIKFYDAMKKYLNIDTDKLKANKFLVKNAMEIVLSKEKTGFLGGVMNVLNKYAVLNAVPYLMSTMMTPVSLIIMGVASLLSVMGNLHKIPHRKSSELQQGLNDLGLGTGAIGWKAHFRNLFYPTKERAKDYTGLKDGNFFGKMMEYRIISGFLAGIPNLVADTLFREKYFELALNRAMDKLGITGTVQSYITRVGVDGKLEYNEEARSVLRYETMKAFADYAGMAYEEKGAQTTRGGWNRIYSYMTQWSTRYTNVTLRNLSKGKIANRTADFVVAGWLDENGAIQTVANELVSNKDMVLEWSKLAFAMRMALRFSKEFGGCGEDDSDRACPYKRFLGIVYLPSQAFATAHPLVNNFIQGVGDFIEDNPYLDHNSSRGQKAMQLFGRFMVRPLLKYFYSVDVLSDAALRAYNGDGIMVGLYNRIRNHNKL